MHSHSHPTTDIVLAATCVSALISVVSIVFCLVYLLGYGHVADGVFSSFFSFLEACLGLLGAAGDNGDDDYGDDDRRGWRHDDANDDGHVNEGDTVNAVNAVMKLIVFVILALILMLCGLVVLLLCGLGGELWRDGVRKWRAKTAAGANRYMQIETPYAEGPVGQAAGSGGDGSNASDGDDSDWDGSNASDGDDSDWGGSNASDGDDSDWDGSTISDGDDSDGSNTSYWDDSDSQGSQDSEIHGG
ncbi:hypothetical protein HK104_006196 [Borealophlyctis nickersoniae]|nr:hypothetical protein HK104_006196 [Borealophlyctis nickersoniae]